MSVWFLSCSKYASVFKCKLFYSYVVRETMFCYYKFVYKVEAS